MVPIVVSKCCKTVAAPPYFANINPVYYLHDAKRSAAGGDQMSSNKMPRRAAVLRLAGAAGPAGGPWARGGDTPNRPSGPPATPRTGATGTAGRGTATTKGQNATPRR